MSPPHCIIYKYGFLHVSITLLCECAHAHLCVCFVHMPTLLLLPCCILEQVSPICDVCVLTSTAVHQLHSQRGCVYVYECVHTCQCFPGGILLLSSVWKKFIIDKTYSSLSFACSPSPNPSC